MFSVTVRKSFSASHRLRDYPGPCAELHGHNFRVEATLEGPALDSQGMLVDFVAVDRALDRILAPLDHAHLNDVKPFTVENPTAESLARHIHRALKEKAGLAPGLRLARVTVYETDDYRADYTE